VGEEEEGGRRAAARQSRQQSQSQLRAVQAFLTKVEVESSSLCAFASLLSAPPRGAGGGQSPRRSPLQTPLSPSQRQLHHLSPRQLPRQRSSSHRRHLLLVSLVAPTPFSWLFVCPGNGSLLQHFSNCSANHLPACLLSLIDLGLIPSSCSALLWCREHSQ